MPQPHLSPSDRRAARLPRALALVAAFALVLATAACGSDDDGSSADRPAATTSTTKADSSGVGSNAITIETPGMEFDVSGPLRPGVATITFTNTSDEAHMLALAPMKPGVTLDQVKAALDQSEDAVGALLSTPPEQAVYGTPAQVGAGQSTTVTSKDLPAGNYALVCFFTDDSGTPHFKMGMVAQLEVTGQKATDEPKSEGTITIDDSGITMPDGFDGHGTFLVTNSGKAPHSISFAKLDDGTTLDAFYQHVGEAMNSGKAVDGGGGTFAGGVDGLLPGQSAYLTVDLAAGHYGYLSNTDANGPAMPVQHGELDVS
jgi:plastocyanin